MKFSYVPGWFTLINLVVIAGYKLSKSSPLATGVGINLTSQMKHQVDKDRHTCHAALKSIRMVHILVDSGILLPTMPHMKGRSA